MKESIKCGCGDDAVFFEEVDDVPCDMCSECYDAWQLYLESIQ